MRLTSYNAKQIADILVGSHRVSAPKSCISNLLIDSRKGRQFEISLFIALEGNFRNGHRFTEEMYHKGVRNFLISQPVKTFPDANYFHVENTLASLQKLATHQRLVTNIPVIGITGSNGKTIVKEWLYQLLRQDFDIIRNPKSYNSQIGVALSVFGANSNYNLALFEAGISEPHEMANLEKIIQPSIGIFTNIGLAHQENFESLQEKANEKMLLFQNVNHLIYNGDSDVISTAANAILPRNKQLIWGTEKHFDLQILSITKKAKSTQIKAIYQNNTVSLIIPFLDHASVENGIHCWLYLLHIKIPKITIQNRFNHIESIAMRLEQKSGVDGSVIINDAYNADATALEIALDYLGKVNRFKKTVILSDVLQSGQSPDLLYARINTSLLNYDVFQFIGIGTEIFEHQDKIEIGNKHFFLNTQQFLDQFHAFDFHNHAILVKGARKFKFEQITSKLAHKTHQTQLEINLDALKHNLRFYRNLLQPKVKTMVMVKAYGYGAGGPEVARVLAADDISYLGVAYADEGVAIRKAGVSTPIMVMNPSEGAFSTMINYNLEPEIYSLAVFNAYSNALSNEGMLNSSYKIHLKLDTGMNRLGFKPVDLDEILTVLKRENYFNVASVFSHLAASNDPKFDDFTRSQLSLFTELADKVERTLGYSSIRHISNTAAIERFKDAQFNMARLGLGLYGVATLPENQEQLATVTSLHAIVVQVKNVKAGESIGYSRGFMAEKDMKIAVIPIGYADGLDRRLGNQVGSVFISGHKRPILGSICMDLIMVDVTGLPTEVNERVEIFGRNISAQEVASLANTISYEILSSIPPRVKRVYIKEDS